MTAAVSPSHILLMGLQGTGKTSFLAALWYMVDQSGVPCDLVQDMLEGDRTYLNTICHDWMEYKAVARNPSDSEKHAGMTLKNKDLKQIKLVFPDLSGESFQLQWSKRQLSVGYDRLMQQASGAILFLSSDKIEKPLRLDTVAQLASKVAGQQTEAPSGQELPAEGVPWDVEKAPTQVQVVELLQVIASRDYFRSPFRLAIMVSAFDVIRSAAMTPKQFIARQLPLLDQFLSSNSELFEVSIYGVSAQGGRYAKPEFKPDMILQPINLINRLKAGKDPVSAKIWADVDNKSILEIENDPAKIAAGLTELLNELLSRVDFYDAERFRGISLSRATQDTLDAHLRDPLAEIDFKRLNRRLMEDVFEAELSKKWEFADEQAKLEAKNPAHRVFITGDGVTNEHDITQPIQWLMR